MTHPQTQDDEAKPGVVVSNEGMTFADVTEHYQENGGLVKLGVAGDAQAAGWTVPNCVMDGWLVEQLQAWPRRVHPDRTTNIQFLMTVAAGVITEQQAALTALRNHEGRK
ncbi:hypothetical protein [Sphingomonas abaci]|uniref:Uncharacterized protein n=1 Tax=Sphingomonas abaci TaxID=237611 RepID=A0A7W7AH54_9SPHN|nr:hypothetical protein [Sphingomonas abaci]MBB4616927.1 hypothetical protein [Sphingomonas abaci]